jgi:hypothetical protein
MVWLIDIALAVCLIILAGGLVHWVNTYLEQRGSARSRDPGPDVDPGMAERLDEVERRLTDVQDVMIALSEKFDSWDERHKPS